MPLKGNATFLSPHLKYKHFTWNERSDMISPSGLVSDGGWQRVNVCWLTCAYWRVLTDASLLTRAYWRVLTDACLLTCAYWRVLTDACLLTRAYWRVLTDACLLARAYWHVLTDVCLPTCAYWRAYWCVLTDMCLLMYAYWCSVFIVYICWQAVAMCADQICQLRLTTSSGHFGTENLEDWCLINRSWHQLLHNCILPIDSYCTEYPSYSKLQWNKGVSLCHVTLSLNLFNPDVCASQPLIPAVLLSSVYHPVWVHFGVIQI